MLSSQGFLYGPEYSLASTANLNNTFLLPGGYKSVNALMMYILSDDYKSYPYCRKHFRLSGNITYLQVKSGANYFPPMAI